MTFQQQFPKESVLRDYLAENLYLVGDGLLLIDKEFTLSSAHGAGGSIDILASDDFGHYVIIEIKKSNASARSALHELSKYIRLLMNQEGLGRDEIRCIIVSSDWHELLEPFSYFQAVADVHIDGYHAFVDDNGSLSCNRVSPRPVLNLPTFSPEFDLFVYSARQEREQHWEYIRSRAQLIPFVRAAMCRLDPKENAAHPVFRSIVCIWRISDDYYHDIEQICGFQIGHLAPYAFQGWEPECDVLFWLASEGVTLSPQGSAESQRGTAEKVANILNAYEPVDVLHCGRSQKKQTLNNVGRVIGLLCGREPQFPVGRHNPVFFEVSTSVENQKTLHSALEAFLEFISYIPEWHRQAVEFIQDSLKDHAAYFIDLKALNKKHVFYAIYQATAHANASLSNFSIEVRDKYKQIIRVLAGEWTWDGSCPQNAVEAIEQVYGSIERAIVSMLSAVDTQRYDSALDLHGFHPIVVHLIPKNTGKLLVVDVQPRLKKGWTQPEENPLQCLVKTRPDYTAQILDVFKQIPTEPGE